MSLSSDEKGPDPGLRGSNTKGARFGWSIAKAGDLNNDEIQGIYKFSIEQLSFYFPQHILLPAVHFSSFRFCSL